MKRKANRIKFECQECGRTFNSASSDPRCRCGSVDLYPADEFSPMKRRIIRVEYCGQIHKPLIKIAEQCAEMSSTPEEASKLFLRKAGEATGADCFSFNW